jgi:hypothetical protein
MLFHVGRVNPIDIDIFPDQEDSALVMEFTRPLADQAMVDKATKIIHLIDLALEQQGIPTDQINLSIGQKQFRLDGPSPGDEPPQSEAMYHIASNVIRKLDTIESQGRSFDDAYALIRMEWDPTFDPGQQAPVQPVDEREERKQKKLRDAITQKLDNFERASSITFPDKAGLIQTLVSVGARTSITGKPAPADAEDKIPTEEKALAAEVASYLRPILGRDKENAINYLAGEVAYAMYDVLKPYAEIRAASR